MPLVANSPVSSDNDCLIIARWSSHQSTYPGLGGSGFRLRQPANRRILLNAFSLTELLVVVAIVSIMLALLGPAISSIKGSSDFDSATYEISDALGRARAYAIAQNTYVWVGFAEVDQTVNATARPQTDGVGRIALSVIGSKDGTKLYEFDPASEWSAKAAVGDGLVQLGKLIRIEHVSLSDSLPASEGMSRPAVDQVFQIGSDLASSALTFTYPLGNSAGNVQYNFSKVIQFDPQGTARIVTQAGVDLIARKIEIGILPTKGNTLLPNSESGNQAAIQVDGMTGATAIFRP
jgi:prepilin-type N-terminal cleavage/methylation domain-containing protein